MRTYGGCCRRSRGVLVHLLNCPARLTQVCYLTISHTASRVMINIMHTCFNTSAQSYAERGERAQ